MKQAELEAIIRGVVPVIKAAVAAEFAARDIKIAALEARTVLPGRDGRDGAPGLQGEKGLDGARGEQGPAGPAGERGPEGQQGPIGATGEKGVDGTNGRDGTLENLKIVQSDDLRTLTFCFKNGDPIEGGVLRLPVVLDRGVFKAGSTYQAGDGVTWAGSYWIAQAETDAKPGDGATPWRMAVRVGREGKAGRDGKDLRDVPVLSATGGRR